MSCHADRFDKVFSSLLKLFKEVANEFSIKEVLCIFAVH